VKSIPIITRRDFLSQGLGIIGVGGAIPTFLLRSALAAPNAASDGRILVVLQLSGGHDGLSAVVPYRNEHYQKARPTTRISEQEVIKLDDDFGLHPNLKNCRELLDKGQFAILHGVGYPNPNRSHFKSMDIWHLADNTARAYTHGWIGRYVDRAYHGDPNPMLTLAVGGEKTPLAIQGADHPGLSIRQPESFRYAATAQIGESYQKLSRAAAGRQNANLDFVSRTAVAASDSSETIQRLATRRTPSVSYPRTPIGTSLQTVANLIAGGMKTRVYYVFHGGFDTHAGQRQRHDRLMLDLDQAVAAFQADLADLQAADRVLTAGFSEFGRRVQENFSQGTDHGVAGPMFLVGPGVKGGLHGQFPGLAPENLIAGDLKHTLDFRSVYATVLERWLATPSAPILGQKFELLDCLKA
jgi:uncharacterized protein (DUF1501 family)